MQSDNTFFQPTLTCFLTEYKYPYTVIAQTSVQIPEPARQKDKILKSSNSLVWSNSKT